MTPEEILRQKRIQLGINEEDFQRKYYSQTDQFDNQNDVGLINEIIGGAKELGRALIKTPVRLTQNVAAAGRILGGQSFEEATAPRYSRLLGEEITPVGTQDGGGLTWQNLKESAGAGLELSSFIPVSRGVQAGFRGAVGAAAREGAVGGGLASAGQQLSETGTINPLNVARDVAIGAGLGGVLGGTVAGVQGVSRATERASRSLGELLDEASQKTQGIQELGRGIGSRIQRGVQRGVDNLEQNAQIAQRARESTPAVANALRSRVDDDLINRIQSIDTPTLNITKRVIETAEDINKGSSNALEPIGEEAVKAFNLIDKERKSIGSRLGEAVNRLSKERNIESSTLYNSLDEKLRQVGISPTYDSKNPLNFPADFSEAERNAVNKLYREATKLGDNISARDIQRMDNLFSKLQRESKVIDQLGDIIVDVSDSEGNITRKNIFQLFRDTFSDELDTLSPEIRELNREYRKYRVLVDDLTDTIFRNTQNLDSLRDIVGTEEFVPNALRRAFSNAVTAPNYREMLRLLEDRARSLGYEGANLEQAGDLAIRLIRDYFPQGEQLAGLRSQTTISQNVPRSAIDVIGNVVNFGKLELSDVQKAIKEMIEERLSNFNPAETAIVSQVDDLVEQAKKYKTAEEFVKSQGETYYHGAKTDFDVFDKSKIKEAQFGQGLYATDIKEVAQKYGETLKEYIGNNNFTTLKELGGSEGYVKLAKQLYEKKHGKVFFPSKGTFKSGFDDFYYLKEVNSPKNIEAKNLVINHLKEKGFTGLKLKQQGADTTFLIFEPNKLKTKSQLTDIWNKANK